MHADLLYYVWAVLLVVASTIAWLTTLLTLPGNWIVAGMAALFALWLPAEKGQGVSWTTVAVLVALALLGELIEFAAGAAGAAKQGASRRAILLALVGTMIGSVLGLMVGVPIPLFGPILGALGGGALGAFVGAYVGESWRGKSAPESFAVGKGALVGRLLGTVGKFAVGGVMLVILTFDAFF